MDKPLAIRLRPNSLKDCLGQKHLIGPKKVLTNLVDNKKIFSMILYGKPGIGKTSIALMISMIFKLYLKKPKFMMGLF